MAFVDEGKREESKEDEMKKCRTGTGSAITSTPLSEQTPPTILPITVDGTKSP